MGQIVVQLFQLPAVALLQFGARYFADAGQQAVFLAERRRFDGEVARDLVEQSLSGSVEHDVHTVAVDQFPDRRAQVLDLITHQYLPGTGLAGRARLVRP